MYKNGTEGGGTNESGSLKGRLSEVPFDSTPKIVVPDTPTKSMESPSIGDNTSLNDDLASIAGSRLPNSSRMSIDSYSLRPSFESSVAGRHNRSFGFDNENHSGSVEYSPLGNNSIFEIVMNTRRKNWLSYPTVNDIPPVVLSSNSLDSSWKTVVHKYVNDIKYESSVYESTNNLKSMTRMEQLKQLERYDSTALDSANGESNSENDPDLEVKEGIKELEEVPSFYFEKDFQLDNARTFHRVLEEIDLHLNKFTLEDQTQREEAYVEFKEKLNYYLDAVEGLLVGEISKSSHKFFHALRDVDSIQQKAKCTVSEIDRLSKTIEYIDSEKIQKRVANLRKIFKRKSLQRLEQGLLQVKQVLIRTEECKILYENEKYDECLDLIHSIDCLIKGDDSKDETLQSWVSDWPYKLIELKSVPALTETREYLTNMRIEIGGKYSLKFCEILLRDLRHYCSSVTANETLSRLQNMTREKKFLELDSELISSVASLIHQLCRCDELASSFNLYQDKFTAEVKSIIKKYLPQERNQASSDSQFSVGSSQPTGSSGSKISRLIKEQTPAEFQGMLVNTFTNSSEVLRRLYRHQKLLLDVSLNEITINGQGSPLSSEHDMISQLDIRTEINEAIRIIQLRMGKIIAVRRDLTSSLRFDHFLKLYSICVLFIQECEAISGEFLTKYLSDILAGQIKNYNISQRNRKIKNIQKKLECEKWMPSIVHSSVQKDVNDIVSSMDLDPLDWIKYSDLITRETDEEPVKDHTKVESKTEGEQNEQNENNENNVTSGDVSNGDRANLGHRKSVVVGDKTFVASDSLLSTIGVIKETLILSTNLPVMYLSDFEKMAYDILKNFNDFAMATATQNGRPLSKSGKNLSIMGESLDCLAEFVLIVQKFYRRLSSFSRDFVLLDQTSYTLLSQQYQSSTESIYLANAPPPPV
ncbi:hypothetical protein HG535_0C01810 [Zygotorulaspora mrakii]|uniref:Vacuolar protein sorting-associated protein 54 n=1 Tax=Zygotorulaspora mrakii TaxID=42260 RepID=A0A7H9B237_ZYGMR|nr:uncharacterized protein HG535_0C01810 [Zygotorulaspora mrakii]QLG71832.1 hypothetical protein HG535_0C01810 [Zygotorulaspora mrakii]